MTQENRTPFKHTGCGGVIAKEHGWRGLVYCCTKCGQVSKDIDDLLLTQALILASREADQEQNES